MKLGYCICNSIGATVSCISYVSLVYQKWCNVVYTLLENKLHRLHGRVILKVNYRHLESEGEIYCHIQMCSYHLLELEATNISFVQPMQITSLEIKLIQIGISITFCIVISKNSSSIRKYCTTYILIWNISNVGQQKYIAQALSRMLPFHYFRVDFTSVWNSSLNIPPLMEPAYTEANILI